MGAYYNMDFGVSLQIVRSALGGSGYFWLSLYFSKLSEYAFEIDPFFFSTKVTYDHYMVIIHRRGMLEGYYTRITPDVLNILRSQKVYRRIVASQ